MYEATIRIDDGGPYARATAAGGAEITLWCNEYCDLLHVSGVGSDGGAALEPIVDSFREWVGIRDSISNADEWIVVTDACLKRCTEGYVEQYLGRHGCLLLPPLRYVDGTKRFRVLALDPDSLTAVYRDLVEDGHDVTVEHKRSVRKVSPSGPLLVPEGLLPDLTVRQRSALVTAYDDGYYDIPRGMTTEELSAQLGVTRRTAEEHLRRAEGKLVSALLPYVRG